jgi:hypothetical protein
MHDRNQPQDPLIQTFLEVQSLVATIARPLIPCMHNHSRQFVSSFHAHTSSKCTARPLVKVTTYPVGALQAWPTCILHPQSSPSFRLLMHPSHMHGQAFGEGYNIPSWGPTSLAAAPCTSSLPSSQLSHPQATSPAWSGLWLHPSYPDGDATSLATAPFSNGQPRHYSQSHAAHHLLHSQAFGGDLGIPVGTLQAWLLPHAYSASLPSSAVASHPHHHASMAGLW